MTRPEGERWSSMIDGLAHKAAVLDLKDITQAIGVGFVRTEQAKVGLPGVAEKDVAQQFAKLARRFMPFGRRMVNREGVVAKSGRSRSIRSLPPFACGLALMRRSPCGRERRQFRHECALLHQRALLADSCASSFQAAPDVRVRRAHSPAEPGVPGTYPRPAGHRPLWARSTPLACAAQSPAREVDQRRHSGAPSF